MVKRITNKFFKVWQTPETTGQKVARGSFILFFEKFLLKGLQFIRTVVIARLLFPSDVGLFALASLVLGAVGVFFQLGLNSAIVQKKEDIDRYLDNVWTANVLRGVVLAGVLFFGAPFFAGFFKNEAAVPLIRALAFLVLAEGFENIGMIVLQREIAFNKIFLYDIVGSITQMGVIIFSALILKDVWALVLGAIAGRLAFMVFSYVIHPYRPKFNFDFKKSWELFGFSKWIVLSGIISFFATRGDSLVIGKLLTTDNLAFYQMAFALGTLPAVEIVKTLGSILFPLYSKLQEDKERLKNAFVRISKVILTIMIPAAAGMFILANEIVTYVYGSRWLPMVPILYVVILIGLLKSFEYLVNPLFLGVGKPYLSSVVMVFQSLVMFSVIFSLTGRYGVVGAAIAALAGALATQIIYVVKLRQEIRFSLFLILRESILPLLASLVMGAVLYWLKTFVQINNQVLLIVFVFLGALVYFITVLTLDRLFGNKLTDSLLWIRRNI